MRLVRRITGGDQDHALEFKRVTSLACNGQMAIVNGIEGSAQQAYTRRHSHLTTHEAAHRMTRLSRWMTSSYS